MMLAIALVAAALFAGNAYALNCNDIGGVGTTDCTLSAVYNCTGATTIDIPGSFAITATGGINCNGTNGTPGVPGDDLTINVGGDMSVDGVISSEGGSGNPGNPGANGGNGGIVTITVGGDMTVGAAISVQAGSGGAGNVGIIGGQGATGGVGGIGGTINITAGGFFTELNIALLNATGGAGGAGGVGGPVNGVGGTGGAGNVGGLITIFSCVTTIDGFIVGGGGPGGAGGAGGGTSGAGGQAGNGADAGHIDNNGGGVAISSGGDLIFGPSTFVIVQGGSGGAPGAGAGSALDGCGGNGGDGGTILRNLCPISELSIDIDAEFGIAGGNAGFGTPGCTTCICISDPIDGTVGTISDETTAPCCECQIQITKEIAKDNDCDGDADEAFSSSVTQLENLCLVYRICVTNSLIDGVCSVTTSTPCTLSSDCPAGEVCIIAETINNVLVNDDLPAVSDADFGDIAPDSTVCRNIPVPLTSLDCTATTSSDTGGDGCQCKHNEGTDTATVSATTGSAICAVSGEWACDQPGSDCSAQATSECQCCPTLDTDSSVTGAGNEPGTAVHDTAILTPGTCTDPITGNGTTVDFYLCGPMTETEKDTNGGCPTGGDLIREDVTVVGGQATSVPNITRTEPGWYCWRAEWSGVPDLCAATTYTNADDECFEIVCTPECTVLKSVNPTTSKVGDIVLYDLGPICNTGTCVLELDTDSGGCNDTVTGPCNTAIAQCFPLPVGKCCTPPPFSDNPDGTPFATDVPYEIQSGDLDPLVNTITVHCSGGGQTTSCSDSAEVDLVYPKFTVNKTCTPPDQTLTAGQTGTPISWEIVLENTGDTGLNICCTDTVTGETTPRYDACTRVAAGALLTITPVDPRPVSCPEDAGFCIENTVSCTATLTGVDLDNIVTPDLANSQLSDECCVECVTPGQCRMTGGHENQPAGDINAAYIDSNTKVTTGGQIGAPNETGCCEDPPQKAQCLEGVCMGGLNSPNNNLNLDPEFRCYSNSDCPASTGSSSICPWGNWQHNHHKGPDDSYKFDIVGPKDHGIANGMFSFHSGTASSPKQAFIQNVKCDDEGWCVQARPAPFKQIFWEGTGVFHNMKIKGVAQALPVFESCKIAGLPQPVVWSKDQKKNPQVYYYTAHVADFGEPAGQRQKPVNDDGCSLWNDEADLGDWSITCAGVSGVEKIAQERNVEKTLLHPLCEADDCSLDPSYLGGTGCPDWYDITIHCGSDSTSPIAYEFKHYILEGNFQLHPPVGDNCNFRCGERGCEDSPYGDISETCDSCPEDCGSCP